ncbi:MAG: S41 family peptidase [Treponema sp.]|jgi:carboxyl-terminal processing protease|nr:S41 family peptidase [Treponema sp.]
MNDQLDRPVKRFPASLVWVGATALLCLFFVFASVPLVNAQSVNNSGIKQGTQRYTSMLQQVFEFIQSHYVDEVNQEALFQGAMKGMFDALGDPYSVYMGPVEMAELNENVIEGTYGGVGLYISKKAGTQPNGQPYYVEVASPIEDTPGWRAGIKPGDLIIEVDGQSTDALSLDEVVSRLKGAPGAQVQLRIRRGQSMEFPVNIVREVIEVPTVKHEMIGDIGYLRLISFSAMTLDRTREALESFRSKGYKSLIIDLRNNYGGLLNSAVGICDLFLEGGVVVSVKSRVASENYEYTARRTTQVPAAIPIVVLINGSSASASEIVAGALKDRGRAYLVGARSYGKGSVQQIYPLINDGFKITTARYYTPSDVNIDKIGIPPDREVLFPQFTLEDEGILEKLINDNRIPAFVGQHPRASAGEIESFAQELRAAYPLDLSLLRRLIREELGRTEMAPIYDLDYDVQLQEGVNILQDGSYPNLLQTTKTLKQLQEEAAAEEDAAA